MGQVQRRPFLIAAGWSLAAFLHFQGATQPAFAQDTPERFSRNHIAAASQVARHLGFANLLDTIAASQNMQGLQKEVFLALGRQRADLKDITEIKMPDLIAPVLAESFTQSELEALLAFLVSDTGKKWTSLQASMAQKIIASLQSSPEVAGALFLAGCASGVVTNVIVKTEEMMRGVGQMPLSLGAALEGSRPLQDRAEASCTCLLNALIEKFGTTDWIRAIRSPHNQGAIAQAAKACPDPLAVR